MLTPPAVIPPDTKKTMHGVRDAACPLSTRGGAGGGGVPGAGSSLRGERPLIAPARCRPEKKWYRQVREMLGIRAPRNAHERVFGLFGASGPAFYATALQVRGVVAQPLREACGRLQADAHRTVGGRRSGS